MWRSWASNGAKAGLIFALMGSTSVFAQNSSWKLTETNGQVSVGRQGVTKVAISGQTLRAGDVIRTGKRSRAVVTRGDQFMMVAANSHIKIANPEKDGVITQVFNYLGNVLFKVDKRKDKHFGVETPYMAAVVKGTTFNVTVGLEGSTVQVTEGAVEVSTLDGGAVELLRPGMIGMVEQTDPFIMTIMGDGTRQIESPNRAADVPDVKAPTVTRTAALSESVTKIAPVAIAQSITNEPVQLAAITNGLIEGESPVADNAVVSEVVQNDAPQELALVTENVVTQLLEEDSGANIGNGDEGDGNNGHGNDLGGEDPSNPGRGNGNGNGQGNGNGNGAEDPSDPGEGNGDEGDGNNGHGNDPGGEDPSNPGQGNGNGNGQGNGNGNAGGNGNGNGNGAEDPADPGQDSGNGNGNGAEDPANPGQGNGNGNGQGNGNGNGDDGDSGKGNGNGNGGGNRNGNGADDPTDPGKGAGNGNGAEDPADPGQGNGNAGGNDQDGEGQGNGNGNGQGNGNGNGSEDPADPGHGNGNGDDNGEFGEDGDGGNGNGKGNGNGRGNGNDPNRAAMNLDDPMGDIDPIINGGPVQIMGDNGNPLFILENSPSEGGLPNPGNGIDL